MRFTAVFLSVFTLFCVALSNAAAAEDSSVATAFHNGVAAFQKSDFKLAQASFRDALSKDPSQIVAWYDLGLSEQRLGNAGSAIAFWRKALVLAPTYAPAQHAIDYARSKLEHADIPHEVETWETLRSSVLVYLSAKQFASIFAVLFFLGTWLLLAYVGTRRRAILDEKPLPSFPVTASLVALAALVVLGLLIAKNVDNQDLRATVVAKKTEARALPDATSTVLFDLYEGLEVIVRQVKAPWVQVTYPGGATGWIARDSIFTMEDRITP